MSENQDHTIDGVEPIIGGTPPFDPYYELETLHIDGPDKLSSMILIFRNGDKYVGVRYKVIASVHDSELLEVDDRVADYERNGSRIGVPRMQPILNHIKANPNE